MLIPVLKPGKLAVVGTNYRRISLFCLAVKVLKRLLQPELYLLPLSPNQHSLHPNHSTITAFLPLAHKVAQGFNQPSSPLCTLPKTIDLTKAFDMVNHTKLALSLSSLSNNAKHWLSAYLKRQTASCCYNFILSPSFHARVGVPEGACISPTLFYFFVFTCPQSENLITISYADDFTVSCSNGDQMAEAVSAHSPNIEELADDCGLEISAPKSTITLFTLQIAQSST